jgi:hypothetical protein
MISYKFNLFSAGFRESQYKQVEARALSAARGASAVDTGAFKRSWNTRMQGDTLVVFSNLRYSAPVELGSSVHKVHKNKIKNALAKIGLQSGKQTIGNLPGVSFSGSEETQTTSRTTTSFSTDILTLIRPKSTSVPSLFNRVFLLGLLAEQRRRNQQEELDGESQENPSN